MSIRDRIEAEAEAAEIAEAENRHDDHAPLPEGTRVTRGHNRNKTLQIRLNGDEYEELELLAKTQELPVSTVARSLLLSSLDTSSSVSEAVNKVDRALIGLRRLLER